MKQIMLIGADFNDITTKLLKGDPQFQNQCDCPIARALDRMEAYNVSVSYSHAIYTEKQTGTRKYFSIDGSIENVERCRKAIASGKKYAVIKVLPLS